MKKEKEKTPFDIAQEKRMEREKELLEKEQLKIPTREVTDTLESTQDVAGGDEDEIENSIAESEHKPKKKSKSNQKSKSQQL